MGMDAGWAFDLLETDPVDNLPWDLTSKEKRAKAMRMVKLIVSPMCGPCSTLRSVFNYKNQDYSEVKNKVRDAMKHVKFALDLCLKQYPEGRLFVPDYTAGATS